MKNKFSVSGPSPVENHREREKGVLVYPVYSRRSKGLSVGINLFPDKKKCSFDCPYCEVFPFSTNALFSLEQMEEDLRDVIADVLEWNIVVKDICFSGNGEPSVSADFPKALEMAGRLRDELVPSAELVLITNGTGLLNDSVFSLLKEAVFSYRLDIWLKVDAGTPEWYQKMNRSEIPFEKLTAKIKEFTAVAPVTIQTMLCKADGEGPPPEEERAWEGLILELAAKAAAVGGLRKVQIYGKARPAPEDTELPFNGHQAPKTSALPVQALNERAVSLRSAFLSADNFTIAGIKNVQTGVEIYP